MCQTARHDDPTITNEERLLRRVPLYQIVKDEDTGYARISSGAFKEKELSVNLESVLLGGGGTVDACLQKHQGYKLVSLTAGQVRQLQQIVCPDPEPPDNVSHGLVCGSKNSRRVHEGLRDSAQWVIPPQAPLYADIAQEKKLLGMPW
jgi:hypothetical protein